MAFEWKDFLTVAEYLAQSDMKIRFGPELALRCAIGRAYYAAFGHACQYAERFLHFIPTHSADDHYLLRIHFRKHRMSKVASKLDKLRIYRNSCDYDQSVANINWQSQIAIESARSIIESLK